LEIGANLLKKLEELMAHNGDLVENRKRVAEALREIEELENYLESEILPEYPLSLQREFEEIVGRLDKIKQAYGKVLLILETVSEAYPPEYQANLRSKMELAKNGFIGTDRGKEMVEKMARTLTLAPTTFFKKAMENHG
jgi:chemotaxis protein histidine kinase CheA